MTKQVQADVENRYLDRPGFPESPRGYRVEIEASCTCFLVFSRRCLLSCRWNRLSSTQLVPGARCPAGNCRCRPPAGPRWEWIAGASLGNLHLLACELLWRSL